MLSAGRAVVVAAAVAAGAAWGQARVVIEAPRPELSCPAGAQPAGGPGSALEASACVKQGPGGQRIFHGPYVAYWPNGSRQSQGQYAHGFRTGRWVFFDKEGAVTGETSFKDGSYDGPRIELYPDGRKRLEEQWVAGKRQGPQKAWDQAGVLTVVEYRDDRPVAR